jgi:hypothetical protein
MLNFSHEKTAPAFYSPGVYALHTSMQDMAERLFFHPEIPALEKSSGMTRRPGGFEELRGGLLIFMVLRNHSDFSLLPMRPGCDCLA